MDHKQFKFAIITPARNEEAYLTTTIKCMLKQTVLPAEWIIVDDGSLDNSGKIIKGFMQNHDFIKYVLLKDRGYRKPGQGVIEAFYEGYKEITIHDYDIISKFDGDLEFPPNTIETIINAFEQNPLLGITGGTRYERKTSYGPFKRVLVPKGFVGGPFKFYRKKCFEDIGGLIKRAGWDGVDTIKANMMGWKTGEIESLKIIHLKPTGSAKGEGLVRACMKYGDVSYYMGGYFWYFILRVVGRSFEGRNIKIGYHMINGYLNAKRANELRESGKFQNFLKKKQRQNMLYWINLGLKNIVK